MNGTLSPFKRLRRLFFGISSRETTFARRGFYQGRASAQEKLEHIGTIFVQGYHLALEDDPLDVLAAALGEIEAEYRGFAFEGAAMALSLLDYFLPFKPYSGREWARAKGMQGGSRFTAFLQGAGNAHAYMLYIGAGWTLGRLPRNLPRMMQRLDPLLSWLLADGYGFHQGFFSWPRFLDRQEVPKHLAHPVQEVFDQGLGRSLWFVKGADVKRIHETIMAFPQARRSNLWSGIGLACAYAGGGEQTEIEALSALANEYRWHLAQGAAFAAKARQRAGNTASHTDAICRLFCGCSSEEAATLTDRMLVELPQGAYGLWRLRIREQLAKSSQRAKLT